MNTKIIAKYLTTARFEVFYHVSDSEKWEFFRHFIHAPFYDPSFCAILDQIFTANQYDRLKKLVRQMRWQKRTIHYGEKDIDMILTLFWAEKTPNLAYSILTHFLAWNTESPDNDMLLHLATNLIFSASCPQDTEAALCILEK